MRPVQTLTCSCCGTRYQQGSFRCCAAIDVPSHVWAQRWHHPEEEDGYVTGDPLCGKCPRHCSHERPKALPEQGELQPIQSWVAAARKELERARGKRDAV